MLKKILLIKNYKKGAHDQAKYWNPNQVTSSDLFDSSSSTPAIYKHTYEKVESGVISVCLYEGRQIEKKCAEIWSRGNFKHSIKCFCLS